MAGTKVKVKVTQGKSTVSPHGTNFFSFVFNQGLCFANKCGAASPVATSSLSLQPSTDRELHSQLTH